MSHYTASPSSPVNVLHTISQFNDIKPQYLLIDETGPVHNKTFKFKLEFGTEVYYGSGRTKKEARQNAASIAVSSTSYPLPEKKNTIMVDGKMKSCINYIYEKSTKLDLPLSYEMKYLSNTMYETTCTFGSHCVVGRAMGKMASKNVASEKMLKLISSIPEYSETDQNKSDVTPENDSDVNKLTKVVRATLSLYPQYTVKDVIQDQILMFETKVRVFEKEFTAVANSKSKSKALAAKGMLAELKKLNLSQHHEDEPADSTTNLGTADSSTYGSSHGKQCNSLNMSDETLSRQCASLAVTSATIRDITYEHLRDGVTVNSTMGTDRPSAVGSATNPSPPATFVRGLNSKPVNYVFGKYIAFKLASFSKPVQSALEKKILNIIFEAEKEKNL